MSRQALSLFVVAATVAAGCSAADSKPAEEVAAPQPELAAAPAIDRDAVAVKIDGEDAILNGDVEDALDAIIASYPLPPEMAAEARAEFRDRVIDQLITQWLVVRESRERNGEPSAEEKAQFLREITNRDTVTIADIAAETGLSEALVEKQLVETILSRNLVDELLASASEPSEQDLKDEFDLIVAANPEAGKTPEQVRAAHILVLVDKNAIDPDAADAEALKKITEIRDRAVAGEDFATLAKEFSDDPGSKNKGGEYTFGRGEMVKEFEEAAFTQEIGVVGEPVRTTYGYHILKVAERIPARELTVDDPLVHEALVSKFKSDAAKNIIPPFLESLRNAAKVEIIGSAVASDVVEIATPIQEPAQESESAAEEAAEAASDEAAPAASDEAAPATSEEAAPEAEEAAVLEAA